MKVIHSKQCVDILILTQLFYHEIIQEDLLVYYGFQHAYMIGKTILSLQHNRKLHLIR